jgi:hypothetical protein
MRKIGFEDDRLTVANTAEAMGLEIVSVDRPWINNKKLSPDPWSIIGRKKTSI